MKLLIIGCGNIGANVAVNIARTMPSLPVTIADINFERACRVAKAMGSSATPCQVDIYNKAALFNLVKQHTVVFNSCGPFYKTFYAVVEAAIDAGVNYVDISDDDDVARNVFSDDTYHHRAEKKGCTILIGCGNGPGFGSVLAKYSADQLDVVDSIRFSTVVPYAQKYFSPAVTEHTFHILSGACTQYINGQHVEMKAFSEFRDVEFMRPFGTYPISYAGHAEPITLPRYVKGVKDVTVGFFINPPRVNEFLRTLFSLNVTSGDKLRNVDLSPLKFFMEFFKEKSEEEEPNIFNDTAIVPYGNANQIEVCGLRGGRQVRSVYEEHIMFYEGDRTFEDEEVGHTKDPTGICARLVLEELIKGNIRKAGVWSPEGCLEAKPYIDKVVREAGKTIFHSEDIVEKIQFDKSESEERVGLL